MPNFVLVHGAWQGSWVWDRVAGELESAGEARGVGRVVAVDLPGQHNGPAELLTGMDPSAIEAEIHAGVAVDFRPAMA